MKIKFRRGCRVVPLDGETRLAKGVEIGFVERWFPKGKADEEFWRRIKKEIVGEV